MKSNLRDYTIGTVLFMITNLGCQKTRPNSSSNILSPSQCQSLHTFDQRLRGSLEKSKVRDCPTLQCRLRRVAHTIRAASTKQEICPTTAKPSPLHDTIRLSLDSVGEPLIWAASLPNENIPNVLNSYPGPPLSDKVIKKTVEKYAPGNQFPVFPYQVMTADYVIKNLPPDLKVNYARTVNIQSKCVLDHTGDCLIRSFSALSGLSYCQSDQVKFGLDHSVFPLILNKMVPGGQFARGWLFSEFLEPKKFLELLLRQGGVGSYIIGTFNATAPNSGHATVLMVEQIGDDIRIVSQDFQQFTQTEGLPVDFRFRIHYSKHFRALVRSQIPESTVFYDSLALLDRQQESGGISELNHQFLYFNAMKISSKPLGVVEGQNLLPYLSSLKLSPKNPTATH